MITMDVKGINWFGNMFQKFENMYLEAEDIMCEDTVKYIENQMQAVGASIKKLYSDMMEDLLPPLSCDLDEIEKKESELPIGQQCADDGFNKKPFKNFMGRPVKANTKQSEDSKIDHNVDNDCICATTYEETCETDALFMPSRNAVKGLNFISHSRQYVGTMDINSNHDNGNHVNRKMAATKIFNEIIPVETNSCRTSQCCEILNEDQNHGPSFSNASLAEVTRLASEADCYNEIESANTEHFPNVQVQVKLAEKKQIDMNSSSHGSRREPVGFSMDRTIQSDDCSNSMVILSHPEQGDKTMKQDNMMFEETCVMVTGDELQLVPKGASNLKANKKTRRQVFSLSKKSARKQEYEELAVWHGNNEKLKGDCLEDQKKLMLSGVSEAEWELV